MHIDVRPTVPNHRNRGAAQLSRNLEKRLLAYAVAAGGGLIGFAQPASAEVIYTPSNIPMAQGFAGGAMTQFDINNDGTPDFAFSNFSYFSHGFGAADLKISPDVTGNQIVGILVKGQQRVTAAALAGGVEVGPNANFKSYPQGLFMGGVFLGSTGAVDSGSWLTVETAYLGLKFMINGETHYGWARIKFVSPVGYNVLSGSIAGYAYETVANQPILTGQTNGTAKKKMQASQPNAAVTGTVSGGGQTLGLLAAGAVGTTIGPDTPAALRLP
jgi:hypothetical protein